MTQYAKITENGTLEYAPRDTDNTSNWIMKTEEVLAAGYLPVSEIVIPENSYIRGYEQSDDSIVPVLAQYEEYVPTYADLRRDAYPPIEEQLDMLYWDSVNSTSTWKDTIAEVKKTYPKPEEDTEDFYKMTQEL